MMLQGPENAHVSIGTLSPNLEAFGGRFQGLFIPPAWKAFRTNLPRVGRLNSLARRTQRIKYLQRLQAWVATVALPRRCIELYPRVGGWGGGIIQLTSLVFRAAGPAGAGVGGRRGRLARRM